LRLDDFDIANAALEVLRGFKTAPVDDADAVANALLMGASQSASFLSDEPGPSVLPNQYAGKADTFAVRARSTLVFLAKVPKEDKDDRGAKLRIFILRSIASDSQPYARAAAEAILATGIRSYEEVKVAG